MSYLLDKGAMHGKETYRMKKAATRQKIIKLFMNGTIKPVIDDEVCDNCPNSIIELIQKCLEFNPSDRPTFAQILDTLKSSQLINEIMRLGGDRGEDEAKLQRIKDELQMAQERRLAELSNQQKDAQKKLRDRMEMVKAKKRERETRNNLLGNMSN